MDLTFQFTSISTIKTVRIDALSQKLCIESSTQSEPSKYSLLDLVTNQLTVEYASINDKVGGTLVELIDSVVISTRHFSNQNPDITAIVLFDLVNDKSIWESESSKLIDIGRNYITVPHPYFKNKVSHIHITEGREIKDVQELKSKAPNNSEFFPLTYTQDSEHFSWFRKFLISKLQHVPVGACEYLELGTCIYISYFIQRGKKFENYLVVADNSGEVIACLDVDKNLDGIAKDTFFILDNQLIFVSNKVTLNIYEL